MGVGGVWSGWHPNLLCASRGKRFVFRYPMFNFIDTCPLTHFGERGERVTQTPLPPLWGKGPGVGGDWSGWHPNLLCASWGLGVSGQDGILTYFAPHGGSALFLDIRCSISSTHAPSPTSGRGDNASLSLPFPLYGGRGRGLGATGQDGILTYFAPHGGWGRLIRMAS